MLDQITTCWHQWILFLCKLLVHDDVIRRKHLPRYWPFVWGIHRSSVNSPHDGQWRWALMFSLICTRINVWVNNREAGDLRHHRAHQDFTVMPITGVLKMGAQRSTQSSRASPCMTFAPSSVMVSDPVEQTGGRCWTSWRRTIARNADG